MRRPSNMCGNTCNPPARYEQTRTYSGKWWLHVRPRRRCEKLLIGFARFVDDATSREISAFCLDKTPDDSRSPALSSLPATTTTSSASCTPARTSSGRCGWDMDGGGKRSRATPRPPASRPSPSPGRPARNRPMTRVWRPSPRPRGAGGAARPLAEPGGRHRGGAEKAHPHQPLQPAPDLARTPTRPRPRRLGRLRLAADEVPEAVEEDVILARLLALNRERAGKGLTPRQRPRRFTRAVGLDDPSPDV